MEPRALLRAAFDAAVRAVQPGQCLGPFIPAPGPGRTIVFGAGKAATTMADAFCRGYARPVSGVVVTRYGGADAGASLPGIDILEAAHPIPDAASVVAGSRVLGALQGLTPADRVVALLSGGGSALLAFPGPGLTLADKQAVTRQLLAAGATIAEINCVRKKLSSLKGGRLARAAAPAEVLVLAISDVPGDDISDVASGPFSPDASKLADARRILTRYACEAGDRVARYLEDPGHETPKPGDAAFARGTGHICARSADALAAAATVVSREGFQPQLMDDAVNCPAIELAATHARSARDQVSGGRRVALITGGETTVQVCNPAGRGGRNSEYLLALALALDGAPGVWALAADSDGIDGTQDNAGALLAPDSLRRAASLGLEPATLLADNRAWDFFAALDDLVVTGPTGTNANDVRIVLIMG